MRIDWFTVGAQALNFVILVWLMRRYLYKPVRKALDTREQHIAAELADADRARAEARTERDTFHDKNEAFDAERATLLARAHADAEATRTQHVAEAREADETSRVKAQEALAREARSLRQALRGRAQTAVFAVVRKALSDLAATSLEASMVQVLVRRLREAEGPARDALAAALSDGTAPALVRSAFELPEAQRDVIRTAFQEVFAVDVPLRYETAPEVLCGIELSARGHKVAWSIADYLHTLEQEVLAASMVAEPAAVPAAEEAQGP